MLGVFAEFERAIIVERFKAGMARAHAPRASPLAGARRCDRAGDSRRARHGHKVARECGVGTSVVQRIKAAI